MRHHHDNGFSLIEATFSIFLATLVLTTSLRIALSMVQGSNRWLTILETSAMSANLQRVLAQDVHSAKSVSTSWGQLMVTTVSGLTYRYALNANGQYVRILQNVSGSAVIAEGVAQVSVEILKESIELHVLYRSGKSEDLFYATLEAMQG